MKASLNILHHHDTDWKRELEFYIDELAILSTRLAEFTPKHFDKEELAQVKHLEKKFIMIREQIDSLDLDLKKRERKIEEKAMDKPKHVDDIVNITCDKIFDHMMELAKNLATTRYEFNRFLSKTMQK